MRRLGLSAVVGCFLLAASPAAAAAPPLQPTGKWVVSYSVSQCVAYRDYGTAEAPLRLLIKAPAIGDVFQLTIQSKLLVRSLAAEQIIGSWHINDDSSTQVSTLRMQLGRSPVQSLTFNLDRTALHLPTGSAPLVLTAGILSHQQGFLVSGMPAVFAALDTCVLSLRKDWNVMPDLMTAWTDTSAAPTLANAPPTPTADGGLHAQGRVASVFSSDDYPFTALDRSQSGIAKALVLIDETGKVADCTLLKSSGVALLDAQTCSVLQERMRYRPATDRSGKPRRDADSVTIRWVMR